MRRNFIYFLGIIFFALFSLIIGRLAFLSIVNGDELASKAENQYTQQISYYQYNRGDFYDTLGRPITGVESPCLVIFTSMLDDINMISSEIANALKLDQSTVKSRLDNAISQGLSSFIFKANLNQEEIDEIESHPLAGVYILTLAARYQAATPLVHLIGFAFQGATANEYQGQSGLEKLYDNYLEGHNGPSVAALTDEKGQQLLGNGFVLLPQEKDDTSADIMLTINIDFQEEVEKALDGKEGAVVVLDAKNGDILAMASGPKYDPYFFEEPSSDDAYVNKCLSLYPPASTFKTVLALAALSEDIPLAENFICTGEYALKDGRIVHCWKLTGHGEVDMAHALANSCNCYFVDLGLRLGGDMIKKYANILGLDEQSVIGYEVAQGDYIDFQSNMDGDIANASIGENGVRLSPLMVAGMTAVVANGGKRIFPRLVKEIVDNQGNIVKSFPVKEPVQVIREDVAKEVMEMYRLAVEEGTAWRADLSGVSSGAKTGTSQYQGIWFTGFAPINDPQWVVTVYLEEGVGGGTEGGEVFAEVVKSLENFSGK